MSEYLITESCTLRDIKTLFATLFHKSTKSPCKTVADFVTGSRLSWRIMNKRRKSVGGLWTARVNAIGSQITIRPQISCAEYIEENRKLVRSRIGERIDNQVQNPFFSFVISALIAIRYRRRQQQEEKETEQRDTVQRKRFTDLVAFFLLIVATNTFY